LKPDIINIKVLKAVFSEIAAAASPSQLCFAVIGEAEMQHPPHAVISLSGDNLSSCRLLQLAWTWTSCSHYTTAHRAITILKGTKQNKSLS
jgi:hypothetical protein